MLRRCVVAVDGARMSMSYRGATGGCISPFLSLARQLQIRSHVVDHSYNLEDTPLSKTIAEVRSEILGYLLDHPQAMDTLDGIATWWVLEQHVQRGIDDVEAALSELVDAGLLIRLNDDRSASGASLPVLYRLNHERLAEIRATVRPEKHEQGKSSQGR